MRLLRQVRLLDLPAQLLELGLLRVALAELVLDRLHLLAQEVLALGLAHLGLDLRLDLRAQLEHLQLAAQDRRRRTQPLLDVRRLEQLLLLLGLEAERRGDEVGEHAGVVDVRRGELQLVGQRRDELDHPRELVLHRSRERLDLAALLVDVGKLHELPDRIRVVRRPALEPDPLSPWTRIRNVPSGMRIIRWTIPAVPISYMSSKPACSTSESRIVTSASMRSPATTSSISLIERSWPIASGVIDCGKTTVSLSGRTGQRARDLDVALEGLGRLAHELAHTDVRT